MERTKTFMICVAICAAMRLSGVVFALIHTFFELDCDEPLPARLLSDRTTRALHFVPLLQNFHPNKLDRSLGQNLSHRTPSLHALVVLWPQAERRQDLSDLSIPILHPSGRDFCTSSNWTASGSSTTGWYFRLAFASGPLAAADIGRALLPLPHVFPDVLRTVVDATCLNVSRT